MPVHAPVATQSCIELSSEVNPFQIRRFVVTRIKLKKKIRLLLDSYFPMPLHPNFPGAGELQLKEELLIHLSLENEEIIQGDLGMFC